MNPLKRAVGYVRVSTQAKGVVPTQFVERKAKAYSYIRFSSKEQEKGDSFRRQTEWSQKWAYDHGYILDEKLRLADKGLSAFYGIHRLKGALGEFLRLVEQGEVEPGSVLLVENLDRLSREQVLDALKQFTNLIMAGITVVTMEDGIEYDRESINANFGQLIMSLVIMARAHDESKMKSFRGKEAWEHKRKEAADNGHKMTARCPEWLKLSKDRQSFIVLSEVAQVINRIFQMKLEGVGSEAIARTLNKEKGSWAPPPRGKGRKFSGGWRKSYIDKILRNRAAIGEFQPHKKIRDNSGKRVRVPEGPPILNYYPAVVPKERFDRVQAAILHNGRTDGNAGGRTGPVNNLFGYLAKCYYCGGSMAYICKGKPPKGGSYLVCDSARRGLGCKKIYIRYDHLEPLILSYCKGLDPSEILPSNETLHGKLCALRDQLQAVEGETAQVERKITNLVDCLEDTDSPEGVKPIKDRIKTLQGQKAELEAQRESLTRQITEATSIAHDSEKQLRDMQDLIDRMAELDGQDRIDLRLNLRSQLRRLIDQINLLPDKNQMGMIFRTGERRLLIMDGDKIRLLDVVPGALRVPAQLRNKPWLRLNRL